MPYPYKYSVVIPYYNRLESLIRCLECLCKQSIPAGDYEIIVVDDASDHPLTRHDIKDLHDLNVKILNHSNNQGPATARNNGIAESRGGIVCFTDSDCLPEPDWLEQIGISIDDDAADYVGGATNCRREGARASFPFSDNPFSVYELKPEDIHFPGCNLAFRRDVLDVCRFDEKIRYPWLEDSDLCWQAHQLGYKAIYNPEMFVIHPLRYKSFANNILTQKKFLIAGYIRGKFPVEFDKEFLWRFRLTNWTFETYYFFLISIIIFCLVFGYTLLSIVGIVMGAKYFIQKAVQIPSIYRASRLYTGKKNLYFYFDLGLTYIFSSLLSLIRSSYIFIGGIRHGQIIF